MLFNTRRGDGRGPRTKKYSHCQTDLGAVYTTHGYARIRANKRVSVVIELTEINDDFHITRLTALHRTVVGVNDPFRD